MSDASLLLRARVHAAVRLRQVPPQRALAAAPDDDRGKTIERYEATLLALWTLLRRGTLTAAEYRQRVQDAFAQAVGTVPPTAAVHLAELEQQALKQAVAMTRFDDSSEDDVVPSPTQRTNWAKTAAGVVWAAILLAGVARRQDGRQQTADTARQKADAAQRQAETVATDAAKQRAAEADATAKALEVVARSQSVTWHCLDDDASCDDCRSLDGESWPLDQVPFWPGQSGFGDSPPDGTQCGGNCRCDLS